MNYALVIGINHYQERPLTGAVNDAVAFSKWLLDKQLVDKDHLKLLTSDTSNEIAMSHHIDIEIVKIVKDAQNYPNEKNRFYFYFSGHGIGVLFTNTGLCLRLWQNALPNCNISCSAYLDAIVNKAVFDEIITFLDCCRDYDFIVDPKSPMFDRINEGNKLTSFITFYSTVFGRVSSEIVTNPQKKHGAFTSFIMDSLNGDAAGNDGKITGNSLIKHIKDNFTSYALKHEIVQNADVVSNSTGGDIVICEIDNKSGKYNYAITFKRNTTVSFFDGLNNPVPVDGDTNITVTNGEVIEVFLPRGIIRLKDNSTGEEKYFTNYNLETMSHEQF